MRTTLVVILLVMVMLLIGCSAAQQISDTAQRVQSSAQRGDMALTEAVGTGEVGPAAMPHVEAAQGEFRAIKADAAGIVKLIPKIEDKTPEWMHLVKWGLIVAGIVAALAAAIYFNIGAVARPFFALFGRGLAWLIPATTATAAKLDAEAVAANAATEEQHRVITLRRATDPAYDTAFKAARSNAKPKAPK